MQELHEPVMAANQPSRGPSATNAKIERMKSRLRRNFARNVRRFRMEAGLTQKQLADTTGFSQSYIWQIESRMNRNFGVDTIAILAVVLDKSLCDLIAD